MMSSIDFHTRTTVPGRYLVGTSTHSTQFHSDNAKASHTHLVTFKRIAASWRCLSPHLVAGSFYEIESSLENASRNVYMNERAARMLSLTAAFSLLAH